jgi:hypothetical protein
MGWPGDLFLRSNITITIVNIVTFPRPSLLLRPPFRGNLDASPQIYPHNPQTSTFYAHLQCAPRCYMHSPQNSSQKLQKTLGVKKVANCQTSSIKVDQKSKF